MSNTHNGFSLGLTDKQLKLGLYNVVPGQKTMNQFVSLRFAFW